MEQIKEHKGITPESVLAAVKEMFAESSERLDREMAKSSERFDREMAKSAAEFDRRSAEFDRRVEEAKRERKASVAELDRIIKDLAKQIGGTSNTQGDFAEEYFYNSIDKKKRNFFGYEFDTIERNRQRKRNGVAGEYDLLLINGQAVGIVEIKFKARIDDIPKVLDKVSTFRATFPEYQHHKLYLGLAAMSFGKGVESKTKEAGIAIMKQVGDTMVVNDKHIKAF
jgi:hypothetical protein